MIWLFLACTGETESGDLGVAGTLTAERVGETTVTVEAEMSTLTAFGVNTNGQAAILLSSSADATCADAADYLLSNSSDLSPELLTPVGACSTYIHLSAYDGTAVEYVDDAASATIALNCAMGDGEYVHEERDDGDVGWYFDGAWWQGTPTGFTLSVEGGDESDLTVSLDMSNYNGSFTYDVEYSDPDPAEGDVTGTATVSWCPDMGPSLAR